jgi:hypothetical protein
MVLKLFTHSKDINLPYNILSLLGGSNIFGKIVRQQLAPLSTMAQAQEPEIDAVSCMALRTLNIPFYSTFPPTA